MSPRISAVIVNYNAGDNLRGLVRSLAAERELARVIIVDNASSDGSMALLEAEAHNAHVELMQNGENRGFGTACNQGAASAGSPYLLFINPDCRISGGALGRLLACLEARPDVDMAGPLVLNTDGSEQRGCRRYLPDPRRALMRVLGFGGPDKDEQVAGFDLTGTALPTAPVEVEAISGACMLVRRQAFADLGGWDEGYFLHCEDLDLCMRLAREGRKIVFVPDAIVTHVQGVSSRGRNVFVLWHKHRGMWRYFVKFQREKNPVWLSALIWIGIWMRFLMLLPQVWFASMMAH